MTHLEFSCGCKFAVKDNSVDFRPDIEKIALDCHITWDLISSGNTKGCFQLESRLGQSIAKKAKPRSIEDLAALVSIMRPGCMEAIVDGKSLTNHYIDRKHGREAVDYFHPSLEEILKETYGILVYQEKSMKIAQEIADFNLKEADVLRKAIGKKKTDVMAEVKKTFMEKSSKKGIVTKEQAEEIFSWIEKSQRYSFNKSHAVSYAFNAYLSAYAKAHFSHEFFTSYLFYSKEKQKPHEEINELVNNAKIMNIDVLPPDLRKLNTNFELKNDNVYFGLSDIKGVGEAVINKIKINAREVEEEVGKKIEDWSWIECLVFFTTRITSTAVKAMISVGACSYTNSNRTKMLYEYDIVSKLTKKELSWLKNFIIDNREFINKDILESLDVMTEQPVGRDGAIANKKRALAFSEIVKSLRVPPFSLEDMPEWVAGKEEFLLGIPLTCTKIDACDTSSANSTCKDIVNKSARDYPMLAVEIGEVREVQIKNGRNRGDKMAFVSVSDSSCSIDCVIFSEPWREYKDLLTDGNTVLINGNLDRNRDSFMIEKVWQI